MWVSSCCLIAAHEREPRGRGGGIHGGEVDGGGGGWGHEDEIREPGAEELGILHRLQNAKLSNTQGIPS